MSTEENTIVENPPKKVSHFRIIIVLLCFIALAVLFSTPSRQILGIDDDSYVAQMQNNLKKLWIDSPLAGPIQSIYNMVIKNSPEGMLNDLKNGKLPSVQQFMPSFNMPSFVPPSIEIPTQTENKPYEPNPPYEQQNKPTI